MVRKKGYRLFVTLAVVLAVLFAVALTELPMLTRANAATVTDTVFEDDFSRENLSDKWIKNDFDFSEITHYAMRFDGHGSYGAAVFYKGYTVDGDCEISFDFRQSNMRANSTTGEWFALLFGGNDSSAHFRGCNAAILMDRRPLTQLMDDNDGKTEILGDVTYNDHPKFRQSLTADAAGNDSLYHVVITVVSMNKTRTADGEKLYTVSVTYNKKGSTAPASPQIVYDDVAADGYFGFSVMANVTYDISDLRITEDGELAASEDFADKASGKGVQIVSAKANSKWKTCNFSASKLYTYYDASIALVGSANGLMLGDCELGIDKKSEVSYEISFGAEIANLQKDSSFGVALGLTKDAVRGDENEYIGIEGLSSDTFRLVHFKGGELKEATNELGKFILEKKSPVEITLSAYYDGRVVIRINGSPTEFKNVVTSGYFGFATRGVSACDVNINSVSVDVNTDMISFAENRSIDFKGVRETVEDDFTYRQRYVDETKWFMGKNVSLPRVFTETNDYISFSNSNAASFFGAKQIYTEFICRFSVTVTQNASEAVGSYLGLSFGKTTREDAAADSPSVMFGKTSSGMVLQALNCSIEGTDSRSVKQPEGLDFWSSDDWSSSPVTYRITVVVRGGKAYVYYADSNADASEMETLRAVLYGMQTRGYVTVSAYGGATFRLNDFAVTNIAAPTKSTLGDDAESVCIDFSDKSLYTPSGTAIAHSSGLSLGNSSGITAASKFTDFLAYIDMKGVSGDCFTVKVGDSFIRFNGDGGIYSELGKVSGGSSLPFTKLAAGGTVMIEARGEYISVSVIAADTPPSLLETPVAVYKTDRRTAAVSVSVETGEDAVLSLSSVRLYTLNPQINIEADNYTGDNSWPVKKAPPTADGQDDGDSVSGCGSVVAADGGTFTGVIVFGGVAAAAIIAIKKRRKGNA